MGKLTVSMNLTMDGYLAGPDGELDWHFTSWTEEMADTLCRHLSQADTILLGRVTYEAMLAYWSCKAADPTCAAEDYAFAFMMNSYPKLVFSNKLAIPEKNTRLLKGNLEKEIRLQKSSGSKHIMVYGSGQLVDALIKANLVDEYQLWVHPVILGKGKRLFKNGLDRIGLKLVHSEIFSSGVVLLCHQTVNTSKHEYRQTVAGMCNRNFDQGSQKVTGENTGYGKMAGKTDHGPMTIF
jgi:dihydrofolate reductase